MTPSKELFELVKSLSQTEKTYFKKYSRMHTVGDQNTYLLLFDAINRQKVYDEKKILIQLAKYDFVRHFAVVKNYLHARILDSLESYHRDFNINTQVRRAITRAEILHRKGLYEQSTKLVEKTKRIAKEFDLDHALLEIYSTLDIILYSEKNDTANLQELYQKTTESFSSIKENMFTHNLSARMANCYGNYVQTRHEKYLKEGQKIINSRPFKEAARSKSYMGKLRYNEILFVYYYMRDDLATAYNHEIKIVQLLNSNSAYLKNNVKKYIATANNLFVLSMEQGNMKAAQTHLLELDKAFSHAKTHSQKAMFHYFYSVDQLHYLCRTGNIQELKKNLPEFISKFNLYENEFRNTEKIDSLTHIAISFYYAGDLKKCIAFLNKLRNEFNLSDNPEAQSFFHLFYLIAHYDAGNREILFSAMQSYYRFLNKKNKVSALERAIILQLRKQPKVDSEEKIKEQFRQFKNILVAIEPSYLDKYIFKYVDFISWLESKIENKPFAEIVREKAKT